MTELTGFKYIWTSNKPKRIHLCMAGGKPVCNAITDFDVVSNDRPKHMKICGTCRIFVGMSKQDAKADPLATLANKKAVKKTKKAKKLKLAQSVGFLQSYEWRALRYKALVLNDGRCECCGRSKQEGIWLNVDHIKPRSKHPGLALKLHNLQILCNECNHGKSNTDETDWREPSLAKLMSEAL